MSILLFIYAGLANKRGFLFSHAEWRISNLSESENISNGLAQLGHISSGFAEGNIHISTKSNLDLRKAPALIFSCKHGKFRGCFCATL